MYWRKQRKVKNFFCSIKKEIIKIDKYGNKTDETSSYKTKFIDSEIYGEFVVKSG